MKFFSKKHQIEDIVTNERWRCDLHRAIIHPLTALSASAKQDDIEIKVASAYRSVERQLTIWNRKATGLQTVLDSNGQPVDISLLSDKQLVFAILRWSALPGASRHHWGTDLDIFDGAKIEPEYQLLLEPSEYTGKGPFAHLSHWLTEKIQRDECFGFYLPYAEDTGGVAPEPWHISHRPTATQFEQVLNCDTLAAIIEDLDIALKPTIITHLEEIYQRFICIRH